MSASSEDAQSMEQDDPNLEALAARLHKKLTFPMDGSLPVAAHRSAGSCMLKLRDSMLRGNELTQSAKMSLLCAGVNCTRRVACEVDDDASIQLIKTTQTLVFSLLALCEPKIDGMEPSLESLEGEGDASEEGDTGDTGDTGDAGSSPPKRRRLQVRDDEQLLLAWKAKSLADKISQESHGDSAWAGILQSDAAVSRAALKEAQFISKKGAMAELYDISCIFFRCSSAAMASSMLASVQPRLPKDQETSAFLTLDVVSMMNDANEHQDEKLYTLADAAESESGQAILRDLILSFKLPQQAVGVRRTICLSRASNSAATKQYPEILNSAHDAAMRGALWTYQEDPDEIHKIATLLAGFALVLVKNKDDIRKGNAFRGRVCLPFLDGPPPPPSVTRLALLPETNEWVVYSLSTSGKPKVRCKKQGYGGFCEGLLLVSKMSS